MIQEENINSSETPEDFQKYLDLMPVEGDNLVDFKMSLGNATSAPSEIIQQVKNVIDKDKENLLDEFIDY